MSEPTGNDEPPQPMQSLALPTEVDEVEEMAGLSPLARWFGLGPDPADVDLLWDAQRWAFYEDLRAGGYRPVLYPAGPGRRGAGRTGRRSEPRSTPHGDRRRHRTGAASGLGAATARALAESGARVYGLDLADAVASADAVPGVHLVGCDVTDAAQVAAALDLATDAPAPLRAIVNCAGIGPSAGILSRGGTHDLPLFAKVVQVNLIGTFTVMTLGAEGIAAPHHWPRASVESW
jgi:enoyl-ACP reductase-like protein